MSKNWITSPLIVSCPSCGGPCALQVQEDQGITQAMRLAPHAVPDADFAPQAILCEMGEKAVELHTTVQLREPDLLSQLQWIAKAMDLMGAQALVMGLPPDELRRLGGRPTPAIHRDADGPYVREAVYLQVGKVNATGASRRACTEAERAAIEAAPPEPPSCILLSEVPL